MDEIIRELSEIDIDILNERAFYEKIFKCLKKIATTDYNSEDLDKLKMVLESIGCEKLKNTNNLADTVEANIFAAKLFISEFLTDDKEDLTEIELLLNRGKRKSLVLEWLENSKKLQESKTKIPYYKLSKKILLTNGYDEEKAEEFIQEMSDDIISKQTGNDRVYMIVASKAIAEKLDLNDEFIQELSFGKKSHLAGKLGEYFEYASSSIEDIVLESMFRVHDAYKELNIRQIEEDNELHMFMPAELIGWNNAKKYSEYVKPILEAGGISINEEELEDKYNMKVRRFFLEEQIVTTEDLCKYIDALPCRFSNDIESVIVPMIEKDGIGKVENIRNEIIAYLLQNPTHDITLLSYEEMIKVYEDLKLKSDSMNEESKEYKLTRRAIKGIERIIEENPHINSNQEIRTQPARNVAIAIKNVSVQAIEDANDFMNEITKKSKPGVTHSDE